MAGGRAGRIRTRDNSIASSQMGHESSPFTIGQEKEEREEKERKKSSRKDGSFDSLKAWR